MTNKDKKLVFLLTSLIILSLSATDIYVSSLPEMVKYFHSLPSVINLTLGGFMIGIAVGTLFAGIFSDRYGRRKILLIAIIAFIIFSLAIACCNNIIVVIIFRICQGLCSSTFLILARQIIKDMFPVEEQISATATMTTGIILSPALAPVVGAYLSSYFDWRACFFASAILGFFVLIWLYFSLPETNAKKNDHLPTIKAFLSANISLMISKRFSGYILSNSCAYGAYYTFIAISSYIYILHYGLSQRSYSYVYLALAVAYLLGNSVTKIFVKAKVRAKKAVLLGCYISGLAGLVNFIYYLDPGSSIVAISTFTIAAMLARAGIGIISAPMQVLVMNDYSEKAGQAIGLLFFFIFVFEFIATVAVSIFHNNPMLGLILISAIFCFVMLPIWVITMKARRKPHDFLPEFLKHLE